MMPLAHIPTHLLAAAAAPDSYAKEPTEALLSGNSPLEPYVFALANVGVALLAIGIVLCIIRMLKGPHLADRVLAADTLSLHVVALVILLAIRFESSLFFDAALVVSILGFASTVAFSQYIYARRGRAEDGHAQDPTDPSASAQETSS